ncbi:hypothetical protein HDE_06392 [Halotydeus destructor]|nr:hypothetical protein HDE_06392 [Halotydeus destructor]
MTEGRSDGGSSPPTNGGGGGGGKSGGNVTTGKDKASPCSAGSPIKAIPVDLTMAAGQLLGPFHDPLQWIRVKYAESATLTTPLDLHSLDSGCFELFRTVEIARNSSEQNLEIVLDEGQFYFRSLFELEANVNRKLYAWFSGDLSDKLPSPLIQTINGTKRYMCGLCSQLFTNPNPVVVHVLFSCPRRHEYLPGTERPKEQPVKLTPSPKDSSTSVHSILATEGGHRDHRAHQEARLRHRFASGEGRKCVQ